MVPLVIRLSLRSQFALALFGLAAMPGLAAALNIELDFGTNNYFYDNPTARAAIEQAADDLSWAITSTLDPVDQNSWQLTEGSAPGQTTTAEYTWVYNASTPNGPIASSIVPDLAADEVKFFVRPDIIMGSTLGTGASAGIGFSASYSGYPSNPSLMAQFESLVDQQSALAQGEYTRGAGPVINTLTGTSTLNFNTTPYVDASHDYAVAYGPAYGTVALDVDENNDGYVDSANSLAQYWHFDHTSPVAAGKNDLYSVALHEMLHALGYGSSETWDESIFEGRWTGTEAIAEHGSGIDLVTDGHVAEGVESYIATGGGRQEVAMDPTVTVGTRKLLTRLDLAFLRDLGYTTIDADFNSDSLVAGGDFLIWQQGVGQTGVGPTTGDADANGTVDAADLSIWQMQAGAGTEAATLASVVPEPTAVTLCATAAWLLLRRPRARPLVG